MFYTVIIALLLGYLLLVILVYLIQGRMVYFPIREIINTPGDVGLDFEEIIFRTKDNVNISAWYIPAENARAVVLFCHGNAGNISHRLDSIRIFHDLNLSVFIFDYRGFGKSESFPTENGTYIDAESSWNYLVNERRVQPEKIILFGRSLGSAVALETAKSKKAGAIIVESGFTSVPELGSKFYPFLPVKLLSRYNYSSINKVSKIEIPKLFIHSPHDELIPYEHGTALFEKAAPPKEFLQIAGGHNDGFISSGEIYIDGLNRFISKYF